MWKESPGRLLHPAFADHTLFDGEQVDFFGADYKLIIPDLIRRQLAR